MAKVEKLIAYWHREFGGHCKRKAGHALKTLGECVELAVACGASVEEIHTTIDAEIKKAVDKDEFRLEPDYKKMEEEIADVYICLLVLVHYMSLDLYKTTVLKIVELLDREWVPDVDGVLHRPGRINT